MKDGADHIVAYFNPGAFKTQGTFFYVMIGFIVTTIIQSSSARNASALSCACGAPAHVILSSPPSFSL